mmetsp:Transcript_177082/g.567930  ORF Transcript_177082/g.567930 Transcript_177082/m.567930 type:complete len:195 (+) Transcript_177082:828-1412(+)
MSTSFLNSAVITNFVASANMLLPAAFIISVSGVSSSVVRLVLQLPTTTETTTSTGNATLPVWLGEALPVPTDVAAGKLIFGILFSILGAMCCFSFASLIYTKKCRRPTGERGDNPGEALASPRSPRDGADLADAKRGNDSNTSVESDLIFELDNMMEFEQWQQQGVPMPFRTPPARLSLQLHQVVHVADDEECA